MRAVSVRQSGFAADWWWSVDRALVVSISLLAALGIVLSLAASPAIARKLGLPEFHFAVRQMLFLLPSCAILLGVSLLKPSGAVRFAAFTLAVSLVAMVLCLFIGIEAKGARRWLDLGLVSLQPSEIMKPAFVVCIAWIFARRTEKPDFPGIPIALALYAAALSILVLQPDFGQAFLVTLVWAGIFFLAGTPLYWTVGLAGVAGAGAMLAYLSVPHVASRVDRFLDPSSGDTYQIGQALKAFERGGLFGAGPGEGLVKVRLPDAHTDYIFAVAGEEFGFFVCLAIAALFAFVAYRGFERAMGARDAFTQLAASGLVLLFSAQALINMGVNLNLLPSKGMTLPFISYGGSSLVALALTMGFLLSLTRRRAGEGVPIVKRRR